MGSRKIDLPPNYDMLPDDLKVIAEEEACFWARKVSHGLSPDSNMLKAKKGVDEEIRRRTK